MRSRSQFVLPLNLEIKIEKNDPVRKLAEICDELDCDFGDIIHYEKNKDGGNNEL